MRGLKKRRRIQVLALAGAAMVGVLITLYFLPKDAFQFYREPSAVLATPPETGETFRLGGIVALGSISEADNGQSRFCIVDAGAGIWVQTAEILPDLFEEGESAVVRGQLDGEEMFAIEVLAKHDENYVPAEVTETVELVGQGDATLCGLEAS